MALQVPRPMSRARTVLAVDHGERHIGLAVTDPEGRHALAHGTTDARPGAGTLTAIRRIIAEEHVERIVVGLPLNLAGEEGSQARAARAFGNRLGEATGLPVEYVDERFTSREAERSAAVKGTEADAEAARLILESWLERQATQA